MATNPTSYSLISLDEAAPAAAKRGFGLGTCQDAGRGHVFVRRDLDIGVLRGERVLPGDEW